MNKSTDNKVAVQLKAQPTMVFNIKFVILVCLAIVATNGINGKVIKGTTKVRTVKNEGF